MSACVPTLHMDTVVSVSSAYSHELTVGRGGEYHSKAMFQHVLSEGILNDDGTLNNDASCLRLAEVALAYAQAGRLFFILF